MSGLLCFRLTVTSQENLVFVKTTVFQVKTQQVQGVVLRVQCCLPFSVNWVITAAYASQRPDRPPKYLPHQWLLCRWTLGPALCVSSSWLGRFPLPRLGPTELLPAHVQRRVRWARSRAQCAWLLRPYLADRLREHNAKYHFLESNLHFKQKKISKNPRCIF